MSTQPTTQLFIEQVDEDMPRSKNCTDHMLVRICQIEKEIICMKIKLLYGVIALLVLLLIMSWVIRLG